eukprot:767251-Hanusia_phi.AAC.1
MVGNMGYLQILALVIRSLVRHRRHGSSGEEGGEQDSEDLQDSACEVRQDMLRYVKHRLRVSGVEEDGILAVRRQGGAVLACWSSACFLVDLSCFYTFALSVLVIGCGDHWNVHFEVDMTIGC